MFPNYNFMLYVIVNSDWLKVSKFPQDIEVTLKIEWKILKLSKMWIVVCICQLQHTSVDVFYSVSN